MRHALPVALNKPGLTPLYNVQHPKQFSIASMTAASGIMQPSYQGRHGATCNHLRDAPGGVSAAPTCVLASQS